MENLESAFGELSHQIAEALKGNESFTLSLTGESSQFSRFNHGKVRQSGMVQDCNVNLVLIDQSREVYAEFPFSEDQAQNLAIASSNLKYLRAEISQVPENPYVVVPQNFGSTREIYTGELLTPEAAIEQILSPVGDLDFTGFYAGGRVVRAHSNSASNSAGQQHWFATDSFFVDYSIFTPDQKAVKGTYSGRTWQSEVYIQQIQVAKQKLEKLSLPSKTINKGNYRVYFAPAAVAEMLELIRGSASESEIQQKNSAFLQLHSGEKSLSPQFNLIEDFCHGNVPRFNQQGEIAPLNLPIISSGKLTNTLISSRTALEYHKVANGANQQEYLRSLQVLPGTLAEAEILTKLHTGLYLSNLHYLNWSDRPSGRITGMTRYACFWVENGEIIAPIEDLRFDDSIYRFLSENLEALTDTVQFIPDVSTYGNRSLGGIQTPGMLVKEFIFTL